MDHHSWSPGVKTSVNNTVRSHLKKKKRQTTDIGNVFINDRMCPLRDKELGFNPHTQKKRKAYLENLNIFAPRVSAKKGM